MGILVALIYPLGLVAQPNPMLPENAVTKVSDHVFAIVGFPNIAIVTGDRGTLVVDTGLGARNGATIVKEVEKLAKAPALYLTTTHVHPEHSSGEGGFPQRTVLIRPVIQQQEISGRNNTSVLELFRSRPQMGELLAGFAYRNPDIVFDKELKLDLGGVTARLLLTSGGHTRGDEVVFIEPDSALISGDLVQNKMIPNISSDDGNSERWIASLDQLAPLNPRFVVPDHGPLGDGSLIPQQRAFLVDIQKRVRQLKAEGKNSDETTKIVVDEFLVKYPDWTSMGSAKSMLSMITPWIYKE